jgi:hypothetical protein
MFSSNVDQPQDLPIDGRWEGPSGPVLVEVKRTSSVRDLRGALVALAYLVERDASICAAVCVVVKSRLSSARLREELDRFRSVLRPEIGARVHLLADLGAAGAQGEGRAAVDGLLAALPDAFHAWLEQLLAAERQRGRSPSLPPRQGVVAALAQLQLRKQPAVTVKRLQELVGASYPTVAAALKDLADKGWLEESPERGVRLRPLTAREWMDLARDHARLRTLRVFTDPTGLASPEQMLRRLDRLKESGALPAGVRIGGVLGAARHFPDLDITAAPRLDLSTEADAVLLARLIDAGLQPKTRPEQRVALAVHASREPWVGAESGLTAGERTDDGPQPPERMAGELECLADLIEMGFTREAGEMAEHLARRGKDGGAEA